MQQRKRHAAGRERFLREAQQHRGVLADGIHHDRPRELGGRFAEHVDSLGFELLEGGNSEMFHARIIAWAARCLGDPSLGLSFDVANHLLYRLTNPVLTLLGGLRRAPVEYLRVNPVATGNPRSLQGRLDQRVPGSTQQLSGRHSPAVCRSQVAWAISRWGGVEGLRVLELGPLEGMHTYFLEQNGAASITAIEGNPRRSCVAWSARNCSA